MKAMQGWIKLAQGRINWHYNRSRLLAPIMFDLMLTLLSMMTNCWRGWMWMVFTASEQQHRLKYCPSRNIVLFNTGKNCCSVCLWIEILVSFATCAKTSQPDWLPANFVKILYTLMIDAILDNAIVYPAGSPDLLYVNGWSKLAQGT